MMEYSEQIAFRERDLARMEHAADREARFASLIERQSRFVFRVAYAILRNFHDSEDVVQETFLKLYRGHSWEAMRDERAFLARTAWRIAVDRLPAKRGAASALDLCPDRGPNPENAALSKDWNAAIHRFVDALPEELRQPLALSTVEDLNSREIGEILGIPEGTVRTRLLRARKILKEKLTALTEGAYEK